MIKEISEREKLDRKVRSVEGSTDRYIQTLESQISIYCNQIAQLQDSLGIEAGNRNTRLGVFHSTKCIDFEETFAMQIENWRKSTSQMDQKIRSEITTELAVFLDSGGNSRTRCIDRLGVQQKKMNMMMSDLKDFAEKEWRNSQNSSRSFMKQLENEMSALRQSIQELCVPSMIEQQLDEILGISIEQNLNIKKRNLDLEREDILTDFCSAYEKAVREFEEHFSFEDVTPQERVPESPQVRKQLSTDSSVLEVENRDLNRRLEVSEENKNVENLRKDSENHWDYNHVFGSPNSSRMSRTPTNRTDFSPILQQNRKLSSFEEKQPPTQFGWSTAFEESKVVDTFVTESSDLNEGEEQPHNSGGVYARRLQRLLDSSMGRGNETSVASETTKKEDHRVYTTSDSAISMEERADTLNSTEPLMTLQTSQALNQSTRKSKHRFLPPSENPLRRSGTFTKRKVWEEMAKQSSHSAAIPSFRDNNGGLTESFLSQHKKEEIRPTNTGNTRRVKVHKNPNFEANFLS